MSEEVEWDTAKENFVPVKQGRPTSALVTPVSVRKRDNELEEAKRGFLADIEAADDPLAAWLKYIKWTQEQYSTQASRAELQQVLESATKALSSSKRYTDDIRLLRIWVQYADCLADPSTVFLYLQDHNIGRDHALLYEAYAAYLELKGNFTQADLVYQEGINRLAKPLERLKQKHSAFQQRMAKRQERQMAEASLGMGPAAADPALTRSTLAPLVPRDTAAPQLLDENGNPIQPARPQHHRGLPLTQQPHMASVALGVRPAPLAAAASSSRSSRAGTVSAAASLWVPGGGSSSNGSSASQQQRSSSLLLSSLGVPASSSSSSGGGSASGSSSNAAPRQLEVHVDEEFGPAGQGPVPTAFPPALGQHAPLPGMAVASKENSSQPGMWAGTKLKQQAVFAAVAPASSKIEVFEDDASEDEECGAAAEVEARAAEQQQQQHKLGLRQRLDAPLAPPVPGMHGGLQQHGLAAVPTAAGATKVGSHQSQQQPQQTLGLRQPDAQPAQQQQPRITSSSSGRSASSTAGRGPSGSSAAAAALNGQPQGYDEGLLKGPDGQEQSFEEVRAAIWRSKAQRSQQQCQAHQLQRPLPAALAAPAAAKANSSGSSGSAQLPLPPASTHVQQQQPADKVQPAPAGAPAGSRKPRAPLQPCKDAASSDTLHSTMTGPDRSDSVAVVAAASSAPTERGRKSQPGLSSSSSRRPPLSSSVPAAAAAGGAAATRARADDVGNVTINTWTAYDAVNGMFAGSDDTTTMHGFGRAAGSAAAAAGGGGGRHLAAADLGGVTMNTRAAFDAMNGMFGGGDDTTTMHGFGRAAAAAPGGGGAGRHLAAADLGGVTMNTRAAFDAMNGMFGAGGDDTTTMHGFASMAAAGSVGAGGMGVGMDPTVTVNTRAAFDYMNGMFGGAADVTLGQTAALGGGGGAGAGARRGGRKTSRLSMAAAAAAGTCSTGPGAAPLGIYEDTELIIGPSSMHTLADAGGGGQQQQLLGLYEDTEFVGAKVRDSSSSGGVDHGSMPGGSDALGLYEDTDFITRPVAGGSAVGSRGPQSMAAAAAAGSSRLELYEDTEFITRPMGANGSGSGTSSRRSMGAAIAAAGGGGHNNRGADLGLYEDTDFITRPVGMASEADAGALTDSSGLGIYEDTEFITRSVVPAAPASSSAAAAGHSGGSVGAGGGRSSGCASSGSGCASSGSGCASSGSGSTMLLKKLDRLSLANEALSRGHSSLRPHGHRGFTREDEEDEEDDDQDQDKGRGPTSGAAGSLLGLYEDTEFLVGDATAVGAGAAAGGGGSSGGQGGRHGGGSSGSSFEVYADTEFLTKPVVSTAAAAARADAERQQEGGRSSTALCSSSSSHDENSTGGLLRVKENVPAAAAGPGSWRQQEGGSGSILQQQQQHHHQHQHQHAYGAAGPSRFGPGSVPNSPGGSRPGTAASTPGRPPRTPGTPSAGLGIIAKHMDSFEVMDSPAVRAALAGMPQHQQQSGTAASSPAASPGGYGARENVPVPVADGKEGQRLQPRSLADRAARAAALQPISASRAEMLGVKVDPHAAAECEEDAELEQQQQAGMVRQSPGRALRSLQFGREHEGSSGGHGMAKP